MSSVSIQNNNQGLENLHPALWRASQLGRGTGDYVACGYPTLAQELPGGGWPLAGMTELLVPQAACAELQLLSPALKQLAPGKIVLINTPYRPQILALAALQLDLSQVLWLPCNNPQDALWATEQIVRNQSCSAVLLWQSTSALQKRAPAFKAETLRRLHIASQAGRSLFCVIRPWESQLSPSPAPLRIKLSVQEQGLKIDIFKRRGAQQIHPLTISLPLSPSLKLTNDATTTTDNATKHIHSHTAKLNTQHARDFSTPTAMDSNPFTPARAGGISSALVG
jgi:protein ImuA